MEDPHANTKPQPEDRKPLTEMNIVVWGCRGCLDYGKVFDSAKTKNFCSRCGGRLDIRNFTFRFGTD